MNMVSHTHTHTHTHSSVHSFIHLFIYSFPAFLLSIELRAPVSVLNARQSVYTITHTHSASCLPVLLPGVSVMM